MKLQASTRGIFVLVTAACVLAGLFVWHLRAKNNAVQEAVEHEKKLQGHTGLYTAILGCSRRPSNRKKLDQFVKTLPNASAQDPLTSTLHIGFENQWTVDTTTYEYTGSSGGENFVLVQIASGYSRDHLDPHRFKLRYTDTSNNRAAAKFVTDFLTSQFKSEFLVVEHEIDEN